MMPEGYNSSEKPTWCASCGNFGVWLSAKKALSNLNLGGDEALIFYGIGCHGNTVSFTNINGFKGLHGRPIPAAEGAKMANHELPVIVIAGDGDTYGEGMNHFISAARSNSNITVVVHDNQIYGLTTGQASPTTQKGAKTKTTPEGKIEEPVNPITTAIAAGATFVARGFAGDPEFTTELIKKAIKHKGFALVDVFQPCVTFNSLNTFQWFREKTYKLEEGKHDASDKIEAMKKALETEKLPIGIFYREEKPTHEEQTPAIKETPLVKQKLEADFERLVQEFL